MRTALRRRPPREWRERDVVEPRVLCDHEPERQGVLTHSRISRDDGHELWRFAKQFCRCKMHGVERADGFDWEATADPSEHGSVNVEDEAAPLEQPSCSSVTVKRPAVRARMICPAGLRERQRRGHELCTDRQWRQGRCVMLQQRGHEGRSLVLNGAATRYASPRSLSIRCAAVPGGSLMSGQSSNGSPGSTGGWRMPAAMSSSHFRMSVCISRM